MILKQLADGLRAIVEKVRSSSVLDDQTLREVLRDLQRALIKADVSAKVVLEITKRVKERVTSEDVPPGFSRKDLLLKSIYEELVRVLGGEEEPRVIPSHKGYKILLVGVEGSGKTTSAAKLAYFYKNRGFSVALIGTDVHRPGAMEQLEQLAKMVGVPVHVDYSCKDPVKILTDGLRKFGGKYDVIIIDTAGRHRNEKELLEEVAKLYKAASPDEVMLVIDASVGRTIGAIVRSFMQYVPIHSIFLTKMDGTAKGGGALVAAFETGASVKFVGTGEKIDEIEVFSAKRFVSRLLGMGDIVSLVERFRAVERELKELENIEKSGKFNLYAMKIQLKALKRMGSLRKLLELLPMFGQLKIPEESLELSEEKIDKWLAILNSMTREELLHPEILNASRIRRIARGSGTSVKDVKELLRAYELVKKMYKHGLRNRALARYLRMR